MDPPRDLPAAAQPRRAPGPHRTSCRPAHPSPPGGQEHVAISLSSRGLGGGHGRAVSCFPLAARGLPGSPAHAEPWPAVDEDDVTYPPAAGSACAAGDGSSAGGSGGSSRTATAAAPAAARAHAGTPEGRPPAQGAPASVAAAPRPALLSPPPAGCPAGGTPTAPRMVDPTRGVGAARGGSCGGAAQWRWWDGSPGEGTAPLHGPGDGASGPVLAACQRPSIV